MHKKFQTNRTRIKGGCQSETKAAHQHSCIDLILVENSSNDRKNIENHQCGYSYVSWDFFLGIVLCLDSRGEARTECDAENAFCASLCQKRLTTRILTSIFSIPRFLIIQKAGDNIPTGQILKIACIAAVSFMWKNEVFALSFQPTFITTLYELRQTFWRFQQGPWLQARRHMAVHTTV